MKDPLEFLGWRGIVDPFGFFGRWGIVDPIGFFGMVGYCRPHWSFWDGWGGLLDNPVFPLVTLRPRSRPFSLRAGVMFPFGTQIGRCMGGWTLFRPQS